MQNKKRYSFRFTRIVLLAFLIQCVDFEAQITNYVSDGGFEFCGNCPNTHGPFKRPQGWNAIDSNQFFAELFGRILTPGQVPLSGYTYQWPRHGNNYIISTIYCSTCTYNTRGYPRNTLKANLHAGKTYCFSMYVNLSNTSSYAISSIGAYFGDYSTDTILHCTIPLTFLTPQIQNAPNNVITDTLNWTLIRGLYTANGSEKYLIIGNFNNDAHTDTLFVNPQILPAKGCDYLYDDISCIDIDLPAFAGRDTSVIPGDSVYIGRASDVGIDEDCFWYKLPTVITPTTPAIDTIAGMWIKPTSTCTYVVKQDVCGNVKWDTVTIEMNPLGLKSFDLLSQKLEVFPVPATDYLEIKVTDSVLLNSFKTISVYNNLNQLVREEEFKTRITTSDLLDGVYFLKISGRSRSVNKHFVVAK